MKCAACSGPYHPATGHVLSENFVLCGPCAISFKDWLKNRMGMMSAKLKNKRTGERMSESFQDAAAKSIVADSTTEDWLNSTRPEDIVGDDPWSCLRRGVLIVWHGRKG
jgi:pullulanase/glycogen debranching enzyme